MGEIHKSKNRSHTHAASKGPWYLPHPSSYGATGSQEPADSKHSSLG